MSKIVCMDMRVLTLLFVDIKEIGGVVFFMVLEQVYIMFVMRYFYSRVDRLY